MSKTDEILQKILEHSSKKKTDEILEKILEQLSKKKTPRFLTGTALQRRQLALEQYQKDHPREFMDNQLAFYKKHVHARGLVLQKKEQARQRVLQDEADKKVEADRKALAKQLR